MQVLSITHIEWYNMDAIHHRVKRSNVIDCVDLRRSLYHLTCPLDGLLGAVTGLTIGQSESQRWEDSFVVIRKEKVSKTKDRLQRKFNYSQNLKPCRFFGFKCL